MTKPNEVVPTPPYVILVNFTDEGKANFKEMYSKVREEVKASIEDVGGKIRGWVTLGQYDAVERALSAQSLRLSELSIAEPSSA
jgi:uncharacterized protein with GYD domain